MEAKTTARRRRSSPSSPPSDTAEPPQLDCPPRFGTPRDPSRPNLLGVARLIAKTIGIVLMPWQEYVIAVATEYDPKTGRPCYRNVWITVPRQSGKTTLVLILILLRAIWWGSPQRISYTAQTAQDAREKLVDDWKPVLRKSAPMWGRVGADKPSPGGLVRKIREQSGSEGIEFVTDSLVKIVASGKASGHGKTLHLGIIDEAMADKDLRREQAMVPAQNTVVDAQIVGLSTMGDADSALLNARVKQGRAAVAAGLEDTIMYAEWSAPPDTRLDDEDAWQMCMPALGHTIDVVTVRAALATFTADPDLGPDEFRRAYLNIPTSGHRTVFPDGAWSMVAVREAAPCGVLTMALDMPPDRRSASIVMADEDQALELIEHRAGVAWVLDRAAELSKAHNAPIVIDEGGPAGSFCDDLEALDVTVIRAKTRDLTQACGAFYDAVVERTIEVRPHPEAATAVEKARKRTVSDAWAWARKVGDHDASPLVAMSLALWGTRHRPDDDLPAAPHIY